MRRFVRLLLLIVLQSMTIWDSVKAQWVNVTGPYIGNCDILDPYGQFHKVSG